MKGFAFGALGALVAAALLIPAAGSSPNQDRTWDVTITNLTRPGSQPLSPPLFIVHSARADVWSLGEIATHPVVAIAEDENNAPAMALYRRTGGQWNGEPSVMFEYDLTRDGPTET